MKKVFSALLAVFLLFIACVIPAFAVSDLDIDTQLMLDDAYEDGYSDGYDEGYNEGYDDGYSEGNEDGIEDTLDVLSDEIYDEGYEEGHRVARKEALNASNEYFVNEAYSDGHEDGYEDGYEDGWNEAATYYDKKTDESLSEEYEQFYNNEHSVPYESNNEQPVTKPAIITNEETKTPTHVSSKSPKFSPFQKIFNSYQFTVLDFLHIIFSLFCVLIFIRIHLISKTDNKYHLRLEADYFLTFNKPITIIEAIILTCLLILFSLSIVFSNSSTDLFNDLLYFLLPLIFTLVFGFVGFLIFGMFICIIPILQVFLIPFKKIYNYIKSKISK